MKIINPHEGAASLAVSAEDGRVLLAIHQDGTVTGEVEDANEAGARFVAYLRDHVFEKAHAPGYSSLVEELDGLIDSLDEHVTIEDVGLALGELRANVFERAKVEKAHAPTNDERELAERLVGRMLPKNATVAPDTAANVVRYLTEAGLLRRSEIVPQGLDILATDDEMEKFGEAERIRVEAREAAYTDLLAVGDVEAAAALRAGWGNTLPEPQGEPSDAHRFEGESEPVAMNPILRGVDLALERLVRRDCFTERTMRIIDELRAEVLAAGVVGQEGENQ